MHFYTYDEWAANAYYSIDAREIPIGGQRTVKLGTDVGGTYLNIYSCWKDPKFNSTYSQGQPVIVPETNKIDCDVGCLYRLKDGTVGCLQSLNAADAVMYNNNPDFRFLGPINLSESPYFNINVVPHVDYFNTTNFKYIMINLNAFAYTDFIDQLLIFQSVYSGAVSFQEMSGFVSFEFDLMSPTFNRNLDKCTYKVKTNLRNDDSQMLAVALLSFDKNSNGNFITFKNLSKFVYGQQDLFQYIDAELLWKQFTPPESAKVIPDSIIHQAKE